MHRLFKPAYTKLGMNNIQIFLIIRGQSIDSPIGWKSQFSTIVQI